MTIDVAPDPGERLQQLLVAILDLGLTVKQAHWNVHGPGFRPTHLQLDELADALGDHADELAERAVTLGVAPDGRVATIAGASPLPALPAGPLLAVDAARAVAERVDAVAALARDQLDPLGDADLVSQDLVISLLAALEKQLWMLRSTL